MSQQSSKGDDDDDEEDEFVRSKRLADEWEAKRGSSSRPKTKAESPLKSNSSELKPLPPIRPSGFGSSSALPPIKPGIIFLKILYNVMYMSVRF